MEMNVQVGLSKRELFASKMMEGLASMSIEPTLAAERAVVLADALLERLKK
jgi:hypothetical protein